MTHKYYATFFRGNTQYVIRFRSNGIWAKVQKIYEEADELGHDRAYPEERLIAEAAFGDSGRAYMFDYDFFNVKCMFISRAEFNKLRARGITRWEPVKERI